VIISVVIGLKGRFVNKIIVVGQRTGALVADLLKNRKFVLKNLLLIARVWGVFSIIMKYVLRKFVNLVIILILVLLVQMKTVAGDALMDTPVANRQMCACWFVTNRVFV
jgi:hypothetical protein